MPGVGGGKLKAKEIKGERRNKRKKLEGYNARTITGDFHPLLQACRRGGFLFVAIFILISSRALQVCLGWILFPCKTPSFLLHRLRPNTLERGWVWCCQWVADEKEVHNLFKMTTWTEQPGEWPLPFALHLPATSQRAEGKVRKSLAWVERFLLCSHFQQDCCGCLWFSSACRLCHSEKSLWQFANLVWHVAICNCKVTILPTAS